MAMGLGMTMRGRPRTIFGRFGRRLAAGQWHRHTQITGTAWPQMAVSAVDPAMSISA